MRLKPAFYRVVENESTPAMLVIRDCGAEMNHPVASVTNDAENVVRQLIEGGLLPPGRRLAYYDSEGQLDELLIRDGRFNGFAPLDKNALTERVSPKWDNQLRESSPVTYPTPRGAQ